MRRIALAGTLALLLVPAAQSGSRPSVLAIEWRGDGGLLMKVDPLTLRPVSPRRLAVGRPPLGLRARSPDGRTLALTSGAEPTLLLIDAPRLKLVRRVRLAPKGFVGAAVWPEPRRLALLAGGDGWSLVIVDPSTGAVAKRYPLPDLGDGARTPLLGDEFLLLYRPSRGIGPARIGLLDTRGRLRSVGLDRVEMGWERERQQQPGFAVDPAGKRAVIVDASGLVAAIDLSSLAVRYHRLPGRVLSKAISGPWRVATFVGTRYVAVTGFDGVEAGQTAAGLRLIDTANWSVRTLDPDASYLALARGEIVAWGASWTSEKAIRPIGLRVYRVDGSRRLSLFSGRSVGLSDVIGRRAYLVDDNSQTYHVVDLATGRVRTARLRWPTVLLH